MSQNNTLYNSRKVKLFFITLITLHFQLLTFQLYGQYGFGTNQPSDSSVIHIVSPDSSQGVILPFVTSITRPGAAANIKGMLVYNLTDSAIQYCDGLQWVTLHPDSLSDHDFYEVGTTSPPNAITDNIYTQGNVGIFATNPQNKLHIGFNTNETFFRASSGVRNLTLTGPDVSDSSTPFIFNTNNNYVFRTDANNRFSIYEGTGVGVGPVYPPLALIHARANQTDSYPLLRIEDENAQARLILTDSGLLDLLSYGQDTMIGSPSTMAAFDADGDVVEVDFEELADSIQTFVADHDFYEAGTTTAPDNINDDIYTNGNIGIGVSNPQEDLHILGGGNARLDNGYLLMRTNSRIRMYNPANDNFSEIYNPAVGGATEFRFNTGIVDAMILDGQGNLGLNTTAPVRKFHIHNDETGADSSFVVTVRGNVGVGTTNPNSKLHVVQETGNYVTHLQGTGVGTESYLGQIATNSNYVLFSGSGGRLGGWKPDGSFVAGGVSSNNLSNGTFHVDGTNNEVGINTGNPSAVFHVHNDVTGADSAFVVTAAGNVGIGTTNPFEKLEIKDGSVHVEYTSGSTSSIGNNAFYTTNGSGSGFGFGTFSNNWTYVNSYGGPISFQLHTGNDVLFRGSGNVGINNTSPTNKLHISDVSDPLKLEGLVHDVSLDTTIVVDANGVLHKRSLTSIVDSIESLVADHDFYEIGTTTSPDAITDNIFTQGNVSIGTATNSDKLHVYGTLRLDGATSAYGTIHYNSGNNSLDQRLFAGGTNYNFYIDNNDGFKFDVGGNERVRIEPGGNVGIGTTSPNSPLHVRGSVLDLARFERNTNANVDAQITVKGARNATTTVDIASINLADYDSDEGAGTEFTMGKIAAGMEDVSGQTGYLRFYTNSGASLTEKMRITKSGNIGIGTSAPLEKFDVYNGNAVFGYTFPVAGGNLKRYVKINTLSGSDEVIQISTPTTNSGAFTGILINPLQVNVGRIRGVVVDMPKVLLANSENYGFYMNDTVGSFANITGIRAEVTRDGGLGNKTSYAGYFAARTDNGRAYAIYSNEGLNYFGDNVGVGTTQPQEELQVIGSALFGNGGNHYNKVYINDSITTDRRAILEVTTATTQNTNMSGILVNPKHSNSGQITGVEVDLPTIVKSNTQNYGFFIDDTVSATANLTAVYGRATRINATNSKITKGGYFYAKNDFGQAYSIHADSGLVKLTDVPDSIETDVLVRAASGNIYKRSISSIADSIADLIDDDDWILDGDTLYSGPDSTVVIRDGRVGIGSTNPSYTMDVIGGILNHTNDLNARIMFGQYNSGNLPSIFAPATVVSSITTGNSSGSLVMQGGGPNNPGGSIILDGGGASGFPDAPRGIAFYSGTKVGDYPLLRGIIDLNGNWGINTNSPSAKFHIHNDAAGSDSAFVVTSAGLVGIGTSNPMVPLQISRSAQEIDNGFAATINLDESLAIADYDDAKKIVFESQSSASNLYTGGIHFTRRALNLQGNHGSGMRGKAGNTILQSNALEFYTSTFGERNLTRMLIDQNGNIGVNETSPQEIFHIDANADSLQIDNLASGTLDNVLMHDPTTGKVITGTISSILNSNTITSVSGNYTALSTDDIVLVDASGGDVTITLPLVANNNGKVLRVKKDEGSANNVVIDGNGAETIDGSTSQTTNVPWTGWVIACNGSKWSIVGRF